MDLSLTVPSITVWLGEVNDPLSSIVLIWNERAGLNLGRQMHSKHDANLVYVLVIIIHSSTDLNIRL